LKYNKYLGQALPTIRNHLNFVQHDDRTNQANPNNEQPPIISTNLRICTMKYFSFSDIVPRTNEALDAEENVTTPVEGAGQATTPLCQQKSTITPKSPNGVRTNDESGEESIA
jgi:hypothetical protein